MMIFLVLSSKGYVSYLHFLSSASPLSQYQYNNTRPTDFWIPPTNITPCVVFRQAESSSSFARPQADDSDAENRSC